MSRRCLIDIFVPENIPDEAREVLATIAHFTNAMSHNPPAWGRLVKAANQIETDYLAGKSFDEVFALLGLLLDKGKGFLDYLKEHYEISADEYEARRGEKEQ